VASSAPKGLTRSAVLDAAAALVDADGWQQLTMTALAARVGIRVPSLYTHVASAEAVLSAVQVRAHEALATRFQRAAMGKTGAQAFRALAQVLRDFAAEHGGLYDLALRRPFDHEAIVVAAEPSGAALSAVIESFGIDPSPDLTMSCLATLHGVIALERAGLFGADLTIEDESIGVGAIDVEAVYTRAVDMVIHLLENP
jgi:AcrR family transcriptional regulator